MTLERDTILHNRYKIVEILGQGGMGSVYRAIDQTLGVEVAVKENLFTTEEYARQFRLEAVILANLRHPNLPRVSDHFLMGNEGQYLVMDFIEGEDLRQRMERVGMLDEDEIILIGAAMCDALGFLHSRKPSILHRDIKPGNVKITPDGHIYLVDFGLAKVVQGSQATTTGARAMTPGYSPPEQYGTARTDPRTDIYSLGATLYAAMTGIIPEDGLARAMDNVQLTPLRKHNPKVSRRLAAVIEKAMAVDPADRFQTPEEFKKALLASKSKTEQLTGNYIITPPPPDFAEIDSIHSANKAVEKIPAGKNNQLLAAEDEKPFVPPRKKRKQQERRRRLTLIWFLLILIIGGFAGVAFFAPDLLPPDLRTALPFLPVLPVTATSTATEMPVVNTATLEEQSTLTAVVTTPAPTNTNALTTPTPIVSPATETPISIPTDTPIPVVVLPTLMGGGNEQIVYVSNRTNIPQLYLSDLTGENVLQITDIADGACQPDWSPDGMKLVFISPCQGMDEFYYNASLFMINADGSDLTRLTDVPGGDFDPAWSPDGTRIAFTSLRDGHADIYLYNTADQSALRITNTKSDVEPRSPAWSPDGKFIVYAVKRFGVYQVWMMTESGEDQRQIVRSGSDYSDYLPTWAPDGLLVVFNQRQANVASLPYVMSLVPQNTTIQQGTSLSYKPLPIEDVDYSPDGLWIAYEGQEENQNTDIIYMDMDGKNRVRLTAGPELDYDPAWRPVISQ
jgi:serine/threonine protein kinase/Tol biopolymer transport system component